MTQWIHNRGREIVIFIAGAAMISCDAPTAGTKVRSFPSTEVVENSDMVAERLQVVGAKTTRVNDLLKVQITAENLTTEDFQFEYRFKWLDADGFEVRTGLSTWNSIHSVARDTIQMQGVAPNKGVTDYEFIVRFPDRW